MINAVMNLWSKVFMLTVFFALGMSLTKNIEGFKQADATATIVIFTLGLIGYVITERIKIGKKYGE